MKKFLYLASIIGLLCFTGFNPPSKDNDPSPTFGKSFAFSSSRLNKLEWGYTFQYDGHDYLDFGENFTVRSIVHNPECKKCKAKQ